MNTRSVDLKDISESKEVPRERLWIFVLFLLLYMISSGGDLVGDTEIRWLTSRQILETGSPALPEKIRLSAEGVDGNFYSFYGPGQSMLLLPFAMLGDVLGSVVPAFADKADLLGQFAASLLLFPACGALTVVLLYTLVLDETGKRRSARILAFILGLATMHWHHTVNTYEESQVAVCFVGMVVCLTRYSRGRSGGYLAAAGLLAGLGLSFRLSAAVVLAPAACSVMVVDLLRQFQGRRLRRALAWIASGIFCVGPFLVALGYFNFIRFGDVLNTGYAAAHDAMGGILLFDTPWGEGFAGLLISPGKSIFLYCPVLFLSLAGIRKFWREYRLLALISLASISSTLIFHASYTYWSGDLAWGPRFLASGMSLWLLPLIPVFSEPGCRILRRGMIMVSVLIQLASVTYSFGLEFAQNRNHGAVPDHYVWRVQESHLVMRLQNIGLHLSGNKNLTPTPVIRPNQHTLNPSVSAEEIDRFHTVEIFPLKARTAGVSSTLYKALWGLWLVLAGLIISVSACYLFLLRNAYRASSQEAISV